jgi:hypothetical protein
VTFSERVESRRRTRLEGRDSLLRALRRPRSSPVRCGAPRGSRTTCTWQLDVSFREDECRVRRDHAPAHLSLIWRFALGRLKRETSCRRGIETKRLKCAASVESREKALFNPGDKTRSPCWIGRSPRKTAWESREGRAAIGWRPRSVRLQGNDTIVPHRVGCK